ncbi:MAG: hypothetical protein BGN88_08080, partial [Clostridiales bacterium 43-6]
KKLTTLYKIIAILILITLLTGCWDKREVDTLSIAVGFGLDIADGDDQIEMTAQMVKPSNISMPEKSSPQETCEAFWNASTVGEDTDKTIRLFNNKMSRDLYIADSQVIVIGQDLATRGIYQYLDYFLRDHESRLDVFLTVCEGKAKDIMSIKPQTESIPAMNIYDVLENGHLDMTSVSTRLIDFASALLSETTAPALPVIKVQSLGTQNAVVCDGTAVFQKDKLIGFLSEEDTKAYMWIKNQVSSGVVYVQMPAGKADYEIVNSKTKVGIHCDKSGKITVKVNITGNGILSSQIGTEDFSQPPAVIKIEKAVNENIKNSILESVQKTQQMHADIFGFGDLLNQKFPNVYDKLKSDWSSAYQKITLDISVNMKTRGSGRMMKPALTKKE